MSQRHICLPSGVDGIRTALWGWPSDCPLRTQLQQKCQDDPDVFPDRSPTMLGVSLKCPGVL